MTPIPSVHAQYYVKRNFTPVFTGENVPRLLYVSKISPEHYGPFPRVSHAHQDHAEVVLITEGEGNFLLDERQYRVRAGDLLVYNAGLVHDEAPVPEDAVGLYCAAFDGLRMPGLPENALAAEGRGCVFPSGDSFGELLAVYELLFLALKEERPGAEAFCHYLLLALLEKALTVIAGTPPPPAVQPDVLAKRVKDYIDGHYMEPLTLQSVGDALRASPYYLAHVFRKAYGYAPKQYLTRRRIGEAQTLLLTTDLPVSAIAERVGYDTQTHFDAQFTKYNGIPPTKYRQTYNGADS